MGVPAAVSKKRPRSKEMSLFVWGPHRRNRGMRIGCVAIVAVVAAVVITTVASDFSDDTLRR